jgi:DNA-binding IclR family transcriptional regulator
MVLVIIKALDILELIAQADGKALTLTEISTSLKMSQPTVANIINTMISRGYIEHVGKKKGYKLGPSSFRLTNEVSYEKGLIEASREAMDQLTAQIDETSILAVLRNQKRYILHISKTNQEIQVQLSPEINVYETASGRLLLALLTEREKENFIQINGLPEKSIWPEAHTPSLLKTALLDIQTKGLVKTNLANRHVIGFAVPIKTDEKTSAALSLFLPEYRLTPEKENAIIKALKLTSQRIEQLLIHHK